ncbi:MAG: hypothetical protein U9R58_06755 [Chloroflexota bacterium]|nr:hypothetical protein [Chloroflexota bacterium]
MARKKQSRGICHYCGKDFAKGSMVRHLSTCPQRQAAIIASGEQKIKKEKLFHLRTQDARSTDFWLDLELRGSATLHKLDDYLRWIWLECCGHLSMFSIGGWGGQEISMKRRIDRSFRPGVELTHIYDFGTESVTLIKCVAVREGKPTTPHPIALMARNSPPKYECIECGEPAQWLCDECIIEHGVWGTLCDRHARTHPHDNYGEPYPLVNSPRMGMCGYDGPAEPPY